MGKLAEELKKRFRTPKDALRALGLPEDLLSPAQLAKDSKLKRGRDGALSDRDAEMRAARDLHGEAFEKEQRRLDRELEDSMIDDQESEPEAAEGVSPERRREVRRMSMGFAARDCLERGMSEDETREHLESVWPMPNNALEGGMGGELAEDDEESASIAEDIDFTMKALEGMGGSATSEYEDEDMLQSKDRKRMAKDARLARDSFDRMFPDARRLDGSDASHRYGDQPEPTLAMDGSSAADDDRFEAWYGASRIGIA